MSNDTLMRFARSSCSIVDAHQLRTSGGGKGRFYCLTCTDEHEVSLVKAKHARYNAPAWFRHAQSATGVSATGVSCGESEVHWHAKHLLQAKAGRYFFDTVRCSKCCAVTRVISTPGKVSVERQVGTFRCDAVLHSGTTHRVVAGHSGVQVVEGRTDIALEVWHTHKTEEEKVASLRQHGIAFAEFDAKHVVECLGQLDKWTPHELQALVKLDNLACVGWPHLCEQCTMYEAHDLHEARAEEDAWNRCYSIHGNRLFADMIYENGRRLKKRALREAFEEAERAVANERPRQRAAYVKGSMRKCAECNRWEHVDDTSDISREVAPVWFDKNRYGHARTVSVCDACAIECAHCWELHPISNALRYGLCFQCNTDDEMWTAAARSAL